uniref:DDE Tnp4 domain-containing protein n=1 Tax=Salmo trutta TaxID=8032 RepID=A0A673W4M9_SALTR
SDQYYVILICFILIFFLSKTKTFLSDPNLLNGTWHLETLCRLAFTYRLGFQTVLQCIMETCGAIERRMLVTHLPQPTEETWRQTSQEFNEKWDFPNCLGSDDGKHVMITKPPNSGRHFLNYKLTFFVVLLGLVDAKYHFTAIQVGDLGRNSDSGIYVSQDAFPPVGEDLGNLPNTMVGGDTAFPLKPDLMRSYEKALGILAARWRILYKEINLLPCEVDTLVVAMCILHNFLTKPCDVEMWLQQSGAGMRQDMRSIAIQANRAGQEVVSVRGKFTKYFTSVAGRIDFQNRMVVARPA